MGASPSSSSSSSAATVVNQPNQLLMKFWQSPKQAAVMNSSSGSACKMPSIMRNTKIGSGTQPIVSVVGYNPNSCDEIGNDTNELDMKLNDVHSPHHDFKSINSNSGSSNVCAAAAAVATTNNMVIGQALAPKMFGCDDTYEDIDKDIRDLERRLESELEEHEKLWSPAEETPISQT